MVLIGSYGIRTHPKHIWDVYGTARGILEGLLKTDGQSLNDEALRTLMAEME